MISGDASGVRMIECIENRVSLGTAMNVGSCFFERGDGSEFH